jgi:exonuclease V gamma subunit
VISGEDVMDTKTMADLKIERQNLHEFHQNAFVDDKYAQHRAELEEKLHDIFNQYAVKNFELSCQWCRDAGT